MRAPPNETAPAATGVAAAGHWLRPLRVDWPRALSRILEKSNAPVVRVVVARVKGSAPRESGAYMLVSQGEIEGTIGGGHLEYEATRAAAELLADSAGPAVRIWSVILGRELSQCCGGSVQLRLERFTRADLPFLRHMSEVISTERPNLWLHGAGHVGQALIRVISDLPFDVTWVDSRPQLLPVDLPENIRTLHAPEPVSVVGITPLNACHLIMTHDHALDYSLCRAILQRGAFAWLGLIGSNSKGAKFRSRLARDGVAPEMIARLVSPIGIGRIESKWPAAIAIGVAAQLLQVFESVTAAREATVAEPSRTGPLPQSPCRSADCAHCTTSSDHPR